MTAVTTYDALQAQINSYLGRDDLADKVPFFIQLAEAEMNRSLRLKLMERYAKATTWKDQPTRPMPDRHVPGDWDVFLEMRDLRVNGARAKNLAFSSIDNLPERHELGFPRMYAIQGRELVLYPTPDAEYELALTYWAEIPPLGEGQPTNDILLRAPDLYLYGALLQSVPFARSSVPEEIWQRFYARAAATLEKSDEDGRFTANIQCNPIRSV